MKKKAVLAIVALLIASVESHGQKYAFSTNALDWFSLGTINAKASMSFERHFTAEVGAKYNGWSFTRKSSGLLVENRQASFCAGVRYWPWHAYSGWWAGAKAQYKDYRTTGLWRYAVDESKALGAGLSGGYSFMVTKHINIDLGLGLWGGWLPEHTLYHCPRCMEIRESGPKAFLDLDEISVSFVYIL